MLWRARPCVRSTTATTSSGISVATGTSHWRTRYGLIPTSEPVPSTASPNGTAVARMTTPREEHEPAGPTLALGLRKLGELRGDAHGLGGIAAGVAGAAQEEDVERDEHDASRAASAAR